MKLELDDIGVGGIGIGVGGIGVDVGGMGVDVGGIGVDVGGIGVDVGGIDVDVGGIDVGSTDPTTAIFFDLSINKLQPGVDILTNILADVTDELTINTALLDAVRPDGVIVEPSVLDQSNTRDEF